MFLGYILVECGVSQLSSSSYGTLESSCSRWNTGQRRTSCSTLVSSPLSLSPCREHRPSAGQWQFVQSTWPYKCWWERKKEKSLISSNHLPPSRIILEEGIWQVHPTHVVILILDCIRNRSVERCKHWQSGERGLILKSRSYYGVPFFFWFSSSSLTSDRWRDQKNGLKSIPGHAVLWKVATLFSTCLPLYGHGLSQKRLLWPKIWKSPQLRGKQEWWPCHSRINPGPCWIFFVWTSALVAPHPAPLDYTTSPAHHHHHVQR